MDQAIASGDSKLIEETIQRHAQEQQQLAETLARVEAQEEGQFEAAMRAREVDYTTQMKKLREQHQKEVQGLKDRVVAEQQRQR